MLIDLPSKTTDVVVKPLEFCLETGPQPPSGIPAALRHEAP